MWFSHNKLVHVFLFINSSFTFYRHQCVIDLKSNSLVIGTTNTRTKFLGEAEIPAECRTNFTDAATNPIPSAASSNSNQTAQVSWLCWFQKLLFIC